jgi:uncharacterized protein YciI
MRSLALAITLALPIGALHFSAAPSLPNAIQPAMTESDSLYVKINRAVRPAMLSEGLNRHEQEVYERHLAYMESLEQSKRLVVAGRTQNPDPSSFGISIIVAPNAEVARAIVNADPFVAEGVTKAELYPFRAAFGDAQVLERFLRSK